MAKYSKAMVVFGVGVLVVSMWCMKGTESSLEDEAASIIHAVKREDPPLHHQGGCGPNHTEGGVEECSGEDDNLGLYHDVDDTFKAAAQRAAFHGAENDDSPNIANNNVNVLGH